MWQKRLTLSTENLTKITTFNDSFRKIYFLNNSYTFRLDIAIMSIEKLISYTVRRSLLQNSFPGWYAAEFWARLQLPCSLFFCFHQNLTKPQRKFERDKGKNEKSNIKIVYYKTYAAGNLKVYSGVEIH